MKRRERALLIFVALVFLWGTIISSPFKYFALMTRNLGIFVMDKTGVAPDFGVLIVYLFSILCMLCLFLLVRSKNTGLVSALCAISSLVFFIIQNIKAIDAIPLSIVIGITLALISGHIKTNTIENYLSDLFILAIPVMILYDALLVPMFDFLKINTTLLAPWIVIPKTSAFLGLDAFGIPSFVWGIIIISIAVFVAVYFTGNNQTSRSKNRQK